MAGFGRLGPGSRFWSVPRLVVVHRRDNLGTLDSSHPVKQGLPPGAGTWARPRDDERETSMQMRDRHQVTKFSYCVGLPTLKAVEG